MKISHKGILARGVSGTTRAALTFPSVVRLDSGALLATYRAGTTKDSADETIECCRSKDGGHTWSEPRRLFPATSFSGIRGSLKVCYLTEIAPGHLLAACLWVNREAYPGKPLFNPRTEGCLPMVILLADSLDSGDSWTPLRSVCLPACIGPPSLTNPILALGDGSLLLSIETNKTYLDSGKWYQRVVFVRSTDQGRTWETPFTISQDPTGRIFNWDQRAALGPDGRMATFAWTYDSQSGNYLNIHRRISTDQGRTWTPPQDLGLTDQAGHPAVIADGRMVLPWVDRFHSHSIRVRLAAAVDAEFSAESETVLYAHAQAAAASVDTGELLENMSLWAFGLPYAESLADSSVLVLYYAGTAESLDIRWCRLDLDR